MSNDSISMERIGRQLVFTAKAMSSRFRQLLADEGSSLPQFAMFNELLAAPGLTQRQLGDAVGLTGSTITHHLDRFEIDGLISRNRDTGDRRVVRVSLTPRGKRHHRRITAVVERHDAEIRAVLGEPDAAELQRILTHLQSHYAEERDA